MYQVYQGRFWAGGRGGGGGVAVILKGHAQRRIPKGGLRPANNPRYEKRGSRAGGGSPLQADTKSGGGGGGGGGGGCLSEEGEVPCMKEGVCYPQPPPPPPRVPAPDTPPAFALFKSQNTA